MKPLNNTEQKLVHGGIGWHWYCATENYTSAWHALYGTAAKMANAHTAKTGHSTTIYPV